VINRGTGARGVVRWKRHEGPIGIFNMQFASMNYRFGQSSTWGAAIRYRAGRQNPSLPYSGTLNNPYIP
jgi:hypothetical protein